MSNISIYIDRMLSISDMLAYINTKNNFTCFFLPDMVTRNFKITSVEDIKLLLDSPGLDKYGDKGIVKLRIN